MKFIISELTAYAFILTLCFKKCVTTSKENKFSNLYYMKNQVLALREEIQINGLEEDSTFTGGSGVKYWLMLPSFSNTFLIGVKRQGLNLITISKKDGHLYQAVEKSIDIEGTITSAVAFNILNTYNHRSEGLVLITTDSPKFEIMWFKIQNYKLVHIWSWIRYSGALSIHYFTVMQEHRLLIVDSSGVTAHVYNINFDSTTPSIRELEIISFNQKVLSLSLSTILTEPFLYVVHKNEIGIYRYKRICSESWIGKFDKMTAINMAITHVYPFHSEGQEYLAIAGRDAAIWRIDPLGAIIPEMNLENILEWIIMKNGPHKERILLFGKSAAGDISVFSNVGHTWSHHPSPPCYKYSKESNEKLETQRELRCLRFKSWAGVVSLEIGDLPTLIFSDRKFYGEMFHVMVNMRRDVFPLDVAPPVPEEESNYFMRMKSNLDGLVSDIKNNKLVENDCNIFDMLTTIENVASKAKEEFYASCSNQSNLKSQNKFINTSNVPSSQGLVKLNKNDDRPITNNLFKKEDGLDARAVSSGPIISSQNFVFNTHPISPDMEEKAAGFEMPNDFGDFNIAGFPKNTELIV